MPTALKPKHRSSNLELFRIITMILIVAHHYVVNSDLFAALLESNRHSVTNIFLVAFGAWGKMGINCFVLITGYFMCKSKITGKKYFKLLFEVMFYKIVIWTIFVAAGLESISLTSLLNTFLPTTSVASGFTDCFLIFYLLIPFVNILIENLDRKKHLYLTATLVFAYTIMGAIPWFTVSFNYISWFFVLYLIAAFIRKYPTLCFDNTKLWGLLTLASVLISLASVVVIYMYGNKIKIISADDPYYLLSDSHRPMALITAVSAFMFFKNLKLPYIGFINTVGATTYGVLLIHSHSDAMRQWLWNDTLDIMGYYNSASIYLHAFVSVIIVFAACSLIDFIRIKTVEVAAMKVFDKFAAKRNKA